MEHISKYTFMDSEPRNFNIKLLGVFLIGIVIGAFFLWMWTATQDALSDKEQGEVIVSETVVKDIATPVQELETVEAQLRSGAIIVRNQPAGMSVLIEKVILEEDGWLVIHEGTASHIGNALGAARFDKGEHNGNVELLRTTEVGITYRAVLYRDNGDKEFSLETDFPFLQNGNQPILTTFIVE